MIDLVFIFSTSGDPKGAVLTHRSMMANLSAICYFTEVQLPPYRFLGRHSL